MSENIQSIDIKDIRKKILSLILPITLENILQMSAGIVSMGMIGRLSIASVNGQGISMRITQIIWAILKGITTGATVFVAQAYGAGDYNKMRRVIQQTLISSVILVIALQQIVFWNAELFLSIFNPNPEVLQNGLTYIKIASWGLPFLAIMMVVAGCLQGMGNAKTPMIIALIMNIVNIIFNYLLIFGILGLPGLGIKGAAIGLVIAQFTAALIGLYVLFNRDGVLNSCKGKDFFKLDFKQIKDVYLVGAPTAGESVLWQIAAIIITNIILSFGDVAYAAHQMGMQAESISYMPALGFSIAATTFIGQAVGAKDKEAGKAYLKETIRGSLMITTVSVIFLVFFPSSVMRILTNNKDVIHLGSYYLILMGLVQIPQNLSGVFSGALRGAGFTKVPMIVAFVGLWGIRVPLSLLLTYVFRMNIIAIWGAMCLDLLFRFILSYILYKRRDLYSSSLLSE